MNIFFTSDTLFGVEEACRYPNRQFEDVDIMNASLVDRWNSVVTSKDIVYVLGNFGDYDFLTKLNGRIVLLEGDREKDDFRNSTFDGRVKFFACKYGVPYLHETNIGDGVIIPALDLYLKLKLNHNSPDVEFSAGPSEYCNIYSDINSKEIVTSYGINVALDLHNLKPVELNTVAFYIKGLYNIGNL